MAALVATLIWTSISCLLIACLWQLRRAALPAADPGDGCTRLSVVLAARDEAPRIGACLEALLSQDHPSFEVIVVDDRSTDGTAEAARRAAAEDSRVRVLASDPPPAGWQGRLHAQGCGAAQATGDWIFFLGADQRLGSRSFLRSLLACAGLRGLDAISVVPFFAGERWWDWWWFRPIANNPLLWGCVLLSQRLWSSSMWSVGALALRRAAFDRVGGVAAAAGCGAGAYDDLGWSRALAAHGLRGETVYGTQLLDVSNWDSLGDFWDAVTRWAAGLFTYRRGGWLVAVVAALATAASVLAHFEVIVDLVRGRVPDLASGALAALAPTVGLAYCYWDRRHPVFAVFVWLTGFLVLAVLGGGAWVRIRNRAHWRGEEIRVIWTEALPDRGMLAPSQGRRGSPEVANRE